MALYIHHSIFHLARLLYVRPETFGPYYVYADTSACCVAIATQKADVWYQHIPQYTKCDVQLIKLLLMMD